VQKARKREMSKQAMREQTERLVKEGLERETITIKQGKTRIESKCAKCGTLTSRALPKFESYGMHVTAAFR
jgi:hypothetical protein